MSADDNNWRSRAACVDVPDPDRWVSDDPADREAAADICRGCQVLAECEADAFDRQPPVGIRAGRTPAETAAVLRSLGYWAADPADPATSGNLLTLLRLCHDGRPFARADLIAADSRIDDRTARDAIAAAERNGWIRRTGQLAYRRHVAESQTEFVAIARALPPIWSGHKPAPNRRRPTAIAIEYRYAS